MISKSLKDYRLNEQIVADVQVSAYENHGSPIASITVNGETTEISATGGIADVQVSAYENNGTPIAKITVNGQETEISAVSKIDVDQEVIEGSENPVAGGAVYREDSHLLEKIKNVNNAIMKTSFLRYSEELTDGANQSLSSLYKAVRNICETLGANAGVYYIKTVDDFLEFAQQVTLGFDYLDRTTISPMRVELLNDLDLADVTDFGGIGEYYKADTRLNKAFRGIFEGNGHTIKNVTVHARNRTNGAGLFNCAACLALINNKLVSFQNEIRNLNVENLVILNETESTLTHVGGIVGYDMGTAIINCHVIGDVSGTHQIGGIVGNMDGTVSGCSYSGHIESDGFAGIGGIIGIHQEGTVDSCRAAGSINVTGTNKVTVGGIVGNKITQASKIINCYSSVTITQDGVDHTDRPIVGVIQTAYNTTDVADINNIDFTDTQFANSKLSMYGNTWNKQKYPEDKFEIYPYNNTKYVSGTVSTGFYVDYDSLSGEIDVHTEYPASTKDGQITIINYNDGIGYVDGSGVLTISGDNLNNLVNTDTNIGYGMWSAKQRESMIDSFSQFPMSLNEDGTLSCNLNKYNKFTNLTLSAYDYCKLRFAHNGEFIEVPFVIKKQ